MKQSYSIRRRLAALFLVVLLVAGLTMSASAATYSAGDSVTVYHDFALPFKLKERNAEGFPWMATGYLTNALVPPSGASWVYCIDYWHSASGGTYTTTDLMQTSAWTSLSAVAQNGITLATIYGCPNNGVNDIYSYAATQLIIWEYQLGQRTNPTQTVTYFNATLSQNSTLRTYYNNILSAMSQHYLAPSFSGTTITLNGYGRENGVTLTDTNGKLANDNWSVSVGAGFHAEQSGNNLLIYADSSVAASSTTTVTLRRSLSVSTGSALGIAVGGQKAILGIPPDPISASLTVRMEATGNVTIQKTSDSGDVSGYCFKIYKHTANLSWYGKSNSSGNVYVTNSSYTASGTKVYTFDNMTDGTYSFLEVLSQKGKDLVFPDSWRITVVKGGTTVFDHTYTGSSLSKDSNGDCRLASVAITGLTGGGTMTMTIHNAPESGDLEVVKTSSDGNVSGISFKVEQYESGGIGWWTKGTYTTNSSGKFSITGLTVGTELRVTELVPDGYVCNSENPQTIRIAAGQNRLNFENEPVPKLEIVKTCSDGNVSNISFKVERQTKSGWTELGTYTTDSQGRITVPNLSKGQVIRVTEIVPDGYVCNSENPQTVTLVPGTNRLNFENKPLPKLEIIKTCSDGNVENISFRVERYFSLGGVGWTNVGTYKTDADGKITIEGMNVGAKLRVTEIVPSGYICNSENPQTVTLVAGTNRLTFENEPLVDLEIVKTCTDGNISNISFKIEQYEPEGGIGWWEKGTYVTDSNGKITIEDMRIGTKLRVTELVPDGYYCSSTNPQEITLAAGTNRLTFVNVPYATLEIVKTCLDGKIDGIDFTVERQTKSGWTDLGTYTTDAHGKITIPNLKRGQVLRVTEIVPEGYVCVSDNPQVITLTYGVNRLTFENEPLVTLEIIKTSSDGNISGISFLVEQFETETWQVMGTYTTDTEGRIVLDSLRIGTLLRVTEIVPEGYVCNSENPQEITLTAGTNTLTFENELQADVEIIKTSPDGQVSGISFLVEKYVGRRWRVFGTYETDSDGKITIRNLGVGSQVRITENVPENYICVSENPQIITLASGTNTVTFENKPIVRLELVKTSDDGNVDGIEFTLSVKRNRLFVDVGTYVTQDGGKILVEDLQLGKLYRLTEHVPEGYIGEQPVQEFTAVIGTNTVSFSNRLIRGSLRIVKVDKGAQTPLEGAGYLLLDASETEIARGYTDVNGELVFENLPYGEYAYQEFEAPAGFMLDDTVYHFSVTQDGVEIAKRQSNAITPGSITVYKVNEDNRPLGSVTFLLEFSVDNGSTWSPVQSRSESDPIIAGCCTSQNMEQGRLTTGGREGKVSFTGLCVDTQLGTVLYRLTEVSTVDGYNLLAEPVFVGSIQPDQELELSFTVVNTPTFKMPATGGSGFLLYTVSLAAAGAAVFFMLVFRKKRRGTAA